LAPKAPKRGASGRPKRIAILSDAHHGPDGSNDKDLWAATLNLLSDAAPDEVVLNGDFGEFTSGSAHVPDAFKAAFADDVVAVRTAIKQVRSAAGRAPITYTEGNHENATIRALVRGAPSFVKGFWDLFAGELDFERLGVEWVPEVAVLKKGNLRLFHGHQVPGRLLPKHHAAKVADLYGGPNLVLAFGHSHREGLHVRPSHEGNCVCVALPCMRTLAPSWAPAAPMGWGQGLGMALVYPDGHADVTTVRWAGGRMEYGGRVYR
jgi:predicted phosphodiesterase